MPARRRTRTSIFLVVGALLAAPLALTGPVHAVDPAPVQVVPPGGVRPGGEPSGLDLSADGRWVAYTGRVGATNGLYLTNRATGETQTLFTGAAKLGRLSISADGQRIAYVLGDPGSSYEGDAQVGLFDRATGTSTLVSTTAGGVAGNAASWEPDLSDDGTVVAFTTRSTNLVPGAGGERSDVVVKVLATGAVEQVSGTGATARSFSPSTSADGDRVAFVTDEQLVAGDTDEVDDVVVRTRSTHEVTLASASAREASASAPAISADGRKVAHLLSEGGRPELVLSGVFVTDLTSGDTVRASVGDAGPMSSPGVAPRLSADGRFVLFTALGSGGEQRAVEGFLRDLSTGTTRWVSRTPGAIFGAGAAISATGGHVLTTGVGADDLTIWTTDLGDPEPDPTPVEPVNVSLPSLDRVRAASGPSYALTVEAGTWEGPAGLERSYEWLRDGRPIAGEGATTYTVRASDFGKRISVRERALVRGNVVGSVDSRAVTVERASSAIATTVLRPRGEKGEAVLDIAVSHSPEVRGQGKVIVLWSGGLRIADVGADGWVRVTVTPWWSGEHDVWIAYVPTSYVKPARTERITVRVRR